MDIIIHETSFKYLEDHCDKFIALLKDQENEYWNRENFLKELPNKFNFSLHATLNDQLVGYVIASSKNDLAYIHKFMVDQDCRGKKIGFHLLKTFIENINKLNYYNIALTTEKYNSLAIKFYLNNGFKISGSRYDSVTGNKLINMLKSKDELTATIAIHQPNFLPWLGYFDKIARCDTFILLDDVQLVRGKSFTSRTKILNFGKEMWLTVPILSKSDELLIKESKIDEKQNWKKKHLKTIYLSYKKSQYFDEIYGHIEQVYNLESEFLIDFNLKFIKDTCDLLGIKTNIINASDILSNKTGLDRIIELLESVGGTKYISGTGAGSKRYIDEEIFRNKHIELIWQPDLEFIYYQNNTKQFVKNLSIIDALFNAKEKLIEHVANYQFSNS
jgi:ribosomal protein S18 acetylase RimI-like enzyme